MKIVARKTDFQSLLFVDNHGLQLSLTEQNWLQLESNQEVSEVTSQHVKLLTSITGTCPCYPGEAYNLVLIKIKSLKQQ